MTVAIAWALIASVTTPLDDATLTSRWLAGDLVSVERARVLRQQRGEDVTVGPIAVLDDLSRLVRCLPLGRVPGHEQPRYRAVRTVVRLERVRLERHLTEGAYADTPLAALLGPTSSYRFVHADQGAQLVRWPADREQWPSETADPRLEPAACSSRRDPPDASRSADRRRVEATMIASLIGQLDQLPPTAAAALAWTYVDQAWLADRFEVPPQWFAPLQSALRAGAPPIRSAGLLLLGRLAERGGATGRAQTLYDEVLADDGRTDAEDSRIRVRLAAMAEPDYARVLDVLASDRPARSADWPAVGHATARALFALDDTAGLERFGRIWLRERARLGAKGPLVHATEDLLGELALKLDAAAAIAWTIEIGDERSQTDRLDRLARWAIDRQRPELAVAIYDRLRVAAAAARTRRGPMAAADLARWTGARAVVEYVAGDAEGFATLIDSLVAQAKDEHGKPLARTAPHRAIAHVAQELLGRLTNDVALDPDRRRFAGTLLEAIVALTARPTRWRTVLERYRAPLALLAGPYAAGRNPEPVARRTRRKPARPIRSVGEVVVPRLPAALDLPDHSSERPSAPMFLVYPDARGQLRHGAPWARAAEPGVP